MTDIERDLRMRFVHYTSFSEDEINIAIKTVADALAIDLADDLVITTEDEIDSRIDVATSEAFDAAAAQAAHAIKDDALSSGWIKDESLDAFTECCTRVAESGY